VGLARRVWATATREDPAALGVGAADEVAGALGGHHGHVDTGRGTIWPKRMLKRGREDGVALVQVGAISAS